MTDNELIGKLHNKLPRFEWIKMMQKRKKMQDANETPEAISKMLSEYNKV